MARQLRIEYPGAFYHITSRGNGRQKIYLDRNDYLEFLELLKKVVDKYNWTCYAYALIPNHYHLLIETVEPNLSVGMRQLNGVYTQKFNYRHKRVGHVFQGRYKSIVVDRDKYFGELLRYIVLNPVKARLAKISTDWKWTSHREMLLKNKYSDEIIVDKKKVIDMFGGMNYYKNYLEEKTESKFWDNLKGNIILGSEDFVNYVQKYITKDRKNNIEIPKIDRFANRLSLDMIFKGLKQGNIEIRDKLILKTNIKYGYSQNDISKHLGIHYSTVSKIIKKKIEKRE